MPEANATNAAASAVKADTAIADAQPSLSEIMAAVKGLVGSVAHIGSRMDAVEKNMPAPTLNAAADSRKDSEEKAKKDAEEKGAKDAEEKAAKDAAEEKVKKDSAEAEEKARKDSEEAAKKDAEESEAMADCQARADSVYQLHGLHAPRKMQGEGLMAYRTRLVRKLQPHSTAWKGADLSAITDSVAFKIAEEAIYADAAAASHAPVTDASAPRLPRAIRRRDENTGHNITTFVGPAGGWMDDFRADVKRMDSLNTKGDKQ